MLLELQNSKTSSNIPVMVAKQDIQIFLKSTTGRPNVEWDNQEGKTIFPLTGNSKKVGISSLLSAPVLRHTVV